jgi:DNA-binding response OmpR family regulator
MAQNKILIVDDEEDIIRFLSLHLTREGFSVVGTNDSLSVMELVHRESPDLIILDIVMPGLNGIDLCTRIREESDVPIIFISCKNEVADKVLGLSIGGDDYITKPFNMTEVTARIKVNLKRGYTGSRKEAEGLENENLLSCGSIHVDLNAYSVTVMGRALNLTSKEFDLLVLLMRAPNRVFTPKQIFERLWDSYGYENDYRTVMVHVSNLRKKIDAYLSEGENPIQTVRGVGYKFISPDKKHLPI